MIRDSRIASDNSAAPQTPNVSNIWQSIFALVDSHPRLILALIILAALVFNLSRIWLEPPSAVSGETDHWWPLVENVAAGKGFAGCWTEYFPFCSDTNQISAQREPAPVLLFTGIYLLTNGSFLAASLIEVVLSLGTLLGIFFLGRELADNRVGLLAAVFWALYLPAVKLVSQVSGDLLATLSLTWGIFFYLRGRREEKNWYWLMAGACLGLSALSRSAISASAVVLALGLLPRKFPGRLPDFRQFPVRSLQPIVTFTATFALLLMPWMIRNYLVFGRPIIGSTLIGYNLYRHNHIVATDDYLHYVGNVEAKQAFEALLARRTDLTGNEDEAQMDAVYQAEANRVISTQPVRYALLSIYRLAPLWFNWQVKDAYGYELNGLDYAIFVQQGLLLVAAALGLRQGFKGGWPLLITVAAITLVYVPVVSRMRYIVVAMPLVAVFSAIGCLLVIYSLSKTRSPRPE